MAILENRKSTLSPLVRPSRTLDLNTKNPSIKSFEETYKTSYSHGLEDIYALENVDIKSVRKIGDVTKKTPEKVAETSKPSKKKNKPSQLMLDLGCEHTGLIPSFLFREPIQVLNLSRPAEKCLIDHGKLLLKDLIGSNLQELIFIKGIGQGHIDEVGSKLKQYLEERSLDQCDSIDFSSWILSLTAGLERKKIFVLLQQYQLADLLSLTPMESVEVNRISEDKRALWIQEMRTILQTEKTKKMVLEDVQNVTDAFIQPWMRRRHFMATSDELLERMQKVSERQAIVIHALDFLSALYFNGQSPIESQLLCMDKEFFSSEKSVSHMHTFIVNKALSYFYKPTVVYPLGQLIQLIEKECAKQWIGFPDGFLEKVLRHSSHLNVYKANGGLHIALT